MLAGADALMPAGYYTLAVPPLLRTESRNALAGAPCGAGTLHRRLPRRVRRFAGMVQQSLRSPAAARADAAGRTATTAWKHCSKTHGFDRVQHEQIQADLRSGRIGLAQNRLPVTSHIEDVTPAT